MYIYFIIIALIILIDRISKLLIVNHFSLFDSVPLIKDVFHLTYTQNTGGAFSILSKSTTLLAIFNSVVILIFLFFFYKQYRKYPQKRWYFLGMSFIIGGAFGNLIDRVYYGYVIDYFDFRLINFAVFNVADSFITIGAIVFCLYLLFDKSIKI